MKIKTTLIILLMALASGQAMAQDNYSRGHHDSDRNGRYQNDHNRYRNRDYGKNYRQRDYRRDQRYARNRYDHHGYSNQRNRGHGTNLRIDYNRLMRYNPERFARWYADTAIAQIEQARRSGCRFGEAKGRWRYNWNDHYRHGQKERRDRSIREVETRERELSQCSHNGYGYRRSYGG